MRSGYGIGVIGVLLTGALLFAVPAFAGDEGEGCKPGERGGKMMEKLTADLGLTQEQQNQLKALREGGRAKGEELMTKTNEVRKAMREELNKPDTDTAKVDGYVDDMTALFKQKAQQRVNGILGMKKVLTLEQFNKLREEMKAKREAWKGKGGHGWGKKGSAGEQEEVKAQ